MTRFNRSVCVAAGVALLSLAAGCLGAASGPRCAAEGGPAPSWVHHEEGLGGYYVGVGQAESGEGGAFSQRQLAEKRALADLTEAIQVTVESSMELSESQEKTAGGAFSSSQTATRNLRVASHLTLSEVTDAGSYQDPATCLLWVRVKIRREFADNLIALKQAKALYQITLDEKEATPAQKLRWISDAQARLTDVDFSLLPKDAGNKDHVTALFARRKAELETSGSRNVVWLLSAPLALQSALAPTVRTLSESHGAAYIDAPCRAADDCLAQAREYRSANLVWISTTAGTASGSLGMHKGTLRLGVTRFDVASGSLLSTHTDEGQIFAFDEDGIDWAGLAEELLAKDAMKKVLE